MKKKQLSELKKMTATDDMVRLAKEDIPVKRQGCRNVEYIYKYGMYLMAEVEGDTLKVAMFLTDHLTLNVREPVYSLFIERGDFIGYDHLYRKWTNATLIRLRFPYAAHQSETYCDEASTRCIQEYLQTDREAFDALQTFQLALRRQQLLQRHKAITDQWDLVMQDVPKLPKEWQRWITKVGLTQNFIFYEYNRKGTTQGYCTWCEKDVPVNNPKHNQEGVCSCCHHKIQYKSVKKMKHIVTEADTAYLVQRCGDGFVVREFMVSLMAQMSCYRKPMFQWRERRRFIYDSSFNETEYYYGYDKTTRVQRWIKGDLQATWGCGWQKYVHSVRGQIYKRNLSSLNRTALGKTGFPEYAKKVPLANPCEYISYLCSYPILEKISKAGLTQLAMEMLNGKKILEYKTAKGLGKSLFIDQARLKRLREKNGGMNYLKWLQFEKEQDTVIADEVISWMQEQMVIPENLGFIRDYMSALQVKNYLECQSEESGEKVKDLITTWEDYLIMAKRMGMDISDPIIYRTKYLVRRHNELAQIVGDKSIVREAEETEKKYPMLPEIYENLKKYEYSDAEYKIIAPQKTEDILLEGSRLRHCIHRNERYFERMKEKESYILFLRKADNDSGPYYTLEVEPNGTVRQKRTFYNRQNADIDQAEKFLQKWQKQLQKKLCQEDYELAKLSKEHRIREMDELRKNQVRLNGNFNGRFLADVLAEDLMEVAETEFLAA